jgi:hypothetical protein
MINFFFSFLCKKRENREREREIKEMGVVFVKVN